MRRLTILTVRVILAAALAAAVIDLPLPARSHARARVHLIDRSDSVRRGPADAPRPEDADHVRQYDQEHLAPGDTLQWASFGRNVAFESTAVDGTETDLAGAIEAALGRNPTEIVLYTDGRADPGRSLLLCRTAGVPVHVFPLGASAVRDVRILRVHAPAGNRVTVDVTVLSTFDAVVPVRLNETLREARLLAAVPSVVSFPDRAPGPFHVKLDVADDCAENNEARGTVLGSVGKRKVLAIGGDVPNSDTFEVERTSAFVDPHGKDVVVLDNVALSADQQRALASWVTDFGGGLILLGGPKSYALGGWKGTPIDEISPLLATPDQKVAAVFVLDASGSMHQPGKLDVIAETVRSAWDFYEKDDTVFAYAFPQGQILRAKKDLAALEATGGTNIAEALENVRRQLVQTPALRRHVFLFTDGETPPQETPQMRKAVANRLAQDQIALTVFTVGKDIPELGDNRKLDDWKALRSKLNEALPTTREVFKENPGTLALHDHPATRGVAGAPLAWMNRTGTRQDAQIVGTVGKPPAVHAAVAFRQAGRGRVGALAFPKPDPRLLAQSIEFVAGESAAGLRLSIDPPVVRARGAGPATLQATYQSTPSGESGTIELRQVLTDAWEAPLPAVKPGTLWVRSGAAQAAWTIPCAKEYEELGVDRKALERIAAETGGRVLRSPAELDGLPRPSAVARRPGRPVFLIAALVLVFVEMALSTFWKP